MSFGDYVKCFGGMGSGWIVAAMEEKNCTEMEMICGTRVVFVLCEGL